MENHYITIENRNKMTISKVKEVDAFDEQTLWANLEDGAIEISGSKLNVEKLDLDAGMLIITGNICGLLYSDKKVKTKNKFLGFIRKKAD